MNLFVDGLAAMKVRRIIFRVTLSTKSWGSKRSPPDHLFSGRKDSGVTRETRASSIVPILNRHQLELQAEVYK